MVKSPLAAMGFLPVVFLVKVLADLLAGLSVLV